MKTVVLERPGQWSIQNTPEPAAPQADEALVRVRRVGVCGTDFHAYRGRQPFFSYPRIVGHELGVEILAIDLGADGLKSGDLCAVEPYLSCGECIACRRGKTNCCTTLQVLGVHVDGGMRERIVVPRRLLHRADSLSLEQLALVETLGIGAHAVDRAGLEAGERVWVIGAGPIGLAVAQFAQLAGAEVSVFDVSRARLEFCRRYLKTERCFQAEEDLAEQWREMSAGEFPTAVFDATGNARSMTKAFQYPAHGGRFICVGLVQAELAFHDPDFHRRELTVLATRNSTAKEFQRIIRMMESGEIDTRPWITHRAVPEEFTDRFREWLEPGAEVVKAMVEF